jgi:hypothetical protein
MTPIMSIFAFRRFRDDYAPVMGLLVLFMLPYTFGSPLFGYVRDQTGSYAPALLAAAPLVILAAALTWPLKSAQAAAGAAPRHAPAE